MIDLNTGNEDKFTSGLFLIGEHDLVIHDNYDKMETGLKYEI